MLGNAFDTIVELGLRGTGMPAMGPYLDAEDDRLIADAAQLLLERRGPLPRRLDKSRGVILEVSRNLVGF